jgi:hypothetical protein
MTRMTQPQGPQKTFIAHWWANGSWQLALDRANSQQPSRGTLEDSNVEFDKDKVVWGKVRSRTRKQHGIRMLRPARPLAHTWGR